MLEPYIVPTGKTNHGVNELALHCEILKALAIISQQLREITEELQTART